MKQFIFGFMAAFVLLAAGGLAFVALGLAPVATSSAPLPFEKLITSIALDARVNKEAPKSSPMQLSDEIYAAGAHIYRTNCAVWVAGAGSDDNRQGGEFFKGKGVTEDPPGVTYWKVANGIRLTRMPGFTGSLSTDQMWQVSLLLANADKLPATVRTVLQQPLLLQ